MVLKNIRTLFKTTPFLYVFLVLAQVAGVMVIMFAYSVYMNNQYSLDASRVDGQVFKAQIINTGEEGKLAKEIKDAFPEILNGYENVIEECSISSTVNGEGVTETPDGKILMIGTLFSVSDAKYATVTELPEIHVEGRLISTEDMNSGKYVCVVSKEMHDEYGDVVKIGSDEYEVIGWEKDGLSDINRAHYFTLDPCRIPLEAFPDAVTEVDIIIYFNRVLTSKEYKDLGDRFSSSFGYITEMTEGYEVKLDTEKSLKTMMRSVVFMGLISAYSSIKFYGYILEKRRKATAIYLVCGATKGAAGRLYMSEVLLIQAITTVSGILIYMKLVLPNIYEKYKYLALIFEDNSDCYKLVLIYLVLVLAVSFVAIVANVWRTPIQTLKRNYKK